MVIKEVVKVETMVFIKEVIVVKMMAVAMVLTTVVTTAEI